LLNRTYFWCEVRNSDLTKQEVVPRQTLQAIGDHGSRRTSCDAPKSDPNFLMI